MSTSTERRLRDVLDTMAEQVTPASDAYRRVQSAWRGRERRRRLAVAAVAAVLIAGADVAGLWALNQAPSAPPVVFNGPAPAQVDAPGGH